MPRNEDWRRQVKNLLGVALIAAPLLLLVGDLATMSLYDGDNETRYLADIADNEAVYYAGNLLGAIGAVFLVGAVVALVHLVRVRHPRYAMIVGGLALVGAITMSGVWMTFTMVEIEMAQSGDRAAMAALIAASEDSAFIVPLFVTFVGSSLGLVLLAIGLWRAGTVPRWIPAALVVGFVVLFVGDSSGFGTVGGVIVLVALGALGLLVLRSSVDEWEAGEITPTPAEAPRSPAAATP